MKKSTTEKPIWRMLVVLATVAALLGACAKPTVAPTPTMPAAQPVPTPIRVLKVAFLHVGYTGDGGWTQAHHEGAEESKEEVPFPVEIKEVENLFNDQDIVRSAQDLIRNWGANLIISTAENHEKPLIEVVKEHPEVWFLQLHGHNHLEAFPLPNWSTHWGRMYEASALAARVVCEMLQAGDEVGFMGAYSNNAQVVERLNASKIGCDSCGRSVTFRATFIQDWVDAQKARIAAEMLLTFPNVWAVIQHHDTTDAMQALASKRGKDQSERAAIGEGYDSDMGKKIGDKHVVTSAVWHWSAIYTQVFKDAYYGEFGVKHYSGGLKEGVVDLAPFSDLVPQTVRDKVAAMRGEIVSGKRQIFQGPLWKTDPKTNQKVLWVPEGKALSYNEIYANDEILCFGIITAR